MPTLPYMPSITDQPSIPYPPSVTGVKVVTNSPVPPAPTIAAIIRRRALNVAAVIAETRPSLDELRELLEAEMGDAVKECLSLKPTAEPTVIGIEEDVARR